MLSIIHFNQRLTKNGHSFLYLCLINNQEYRDNTLGHLPR